MAVQEDQDTLPNGVWIHFLFNTLAFSLQKITKTEQVYVMIRAL